MSTSGSVTGLPLVCLLLGAAASASLMAASASDQEQRADLTAEDRERVAAVTSPATRFDSAERFESMQAGSGTSKTPLDRNAFSQMHPSLSFAQRETFNLGNALFRKLWVSSPSSTQASDGLGPLFNARGCQSCHIKDGRGQLPANGETAASFLMQLGPAAGAPEDWSGDAQYGRQLQTFATPGLSGEARIRIDYEEHDVRFDDGSTISLRTPTYTLGDLSAGELAPTTALTPRLAPSMIGLGLLEAISDSDILNQEDPDDRDDDGISGRVNRVRDADGTRLGRFGLKADKPTVLEQAAAAFATDMGLSNTLHPANAGDCTDVQQRCLDAPHGEQLRLGKHEVPRELLDLVTFYSSNLAPPVRREVDAPEVLQGKAAFYEAGCAACHTPKYVTSRDAADAQHRFQLIWPYTDMLLHDMGKGLADDIGSFGGVSGREWRTTPLWGAGLAQTVNPQATFLHDGRARTLMEAVLWHGGEARRAREAVIAMPRTERDSLIRFLESL